MKKNLIVLLLIFLPLFGCRVYKELPPESEMIEFMETDEDLFITVYTNYRVLEFDPPTYRGLEPLLDTMKFDSTGNYELIEEE